MLVRDTLTGAMAVARSRGNRTVWLVLSLEGAAYYVFFSRQTRDQVASTVTRQKVLLHQELLGRLVNVQQEYLRIYPIARQVAAQTAMDPQGRHAEEAMIEGWERCTGDFFTRRHRAPRRADVFLYQSPCIATDNAPSPQRVLGGHLYPVSCLAKLIHFCRSGTRAAMRWSVYYENTFGGRTFVQANFTRGNLSIRNLPDYIQLP